jgi:hypothetical protein
LEIDALKRGTIIHDLLNEIFIPFQNKIISSSDYPDIKKALEMQVKKYFKENIHSGEDYLFQKILITKLNQYIYKFIKKINHKFKICETEITLKADYKLQKIDVPFKGRIDRIDQLYISEEPVRMIIDYKTGNSSQKFKYTDKLIEESNIEIIRKYIQSLQLPVYIYLYMQENPETKIEHIDAQLMFLGDLQQKSLLKHKKLDKKEVYDYYLNILDAVLTDLFNGEKSFKKYNDTRCEYCDLQTLCKYK